MMMFRRRMRTVTASLALGLATTVAAACATPLASDAPAESTADSTGDTADSGDATDSDQPGGSDKAEEPDGSPSGGSSPSAPEAAQRPPGEIRLAFAGDVHFERQLRDRLDDPETALDPIQPALSDADLTMVNLETAITSGGTAEPKNYTFRAPPRALDALAAAGVDVATMANNHGADYGADGLADTLDAAATGPVAVVGIGADSDEAFAPYVTEVAGQRIGFLGATAFADPTTDNWAAADDRPGVAVALDPTRLIDEVREARDETDALVVYVHWGIERQTCPTPEQRELAGLLADAGADVVVGSHAHVQQGAGMLDETYAAYGLGNFVWYGRNSTAEATTGVLRLTLDGREVVDSDWTPALIEADGLPHPVTDADQNTMVADFAELRSCTDLTPPPGLDP